MPCRGQAHPHRLTSTLQQQPPSATGFGRDSGAGRPLRLGRRAEQSRRLQPCGAWAGERWSRAFAAARSRARQFLQVTLCISWPPLMVESCAAARNTSFCGVASAVPGMWHPVTPARLMRGVSQALHITAQDQQQHFQRPDADDAAARDQPAGVSQGPGDQHGSRSPSRPGVRPQAGKDGDSSREQPSSSAQPQDKAAVQLSVQDAEREDWKAVRLFVPGVCRARLSVRAAG